jgi:peptidoglycan/LPS O-acetylase OafA/YrhL
LGPDYKPQLDSVRAVAMAGVLYVHFWNTSPVLEGVRVALFFVLSGYLITRMLLRARGLDRWRTIRNFYARRLLRLQPALLIMLAIAAAYNFEHIRATFLWHVFQLSNFLFILQRSFDPWVTAHLWSLNVVEQFYAFWPLVILFLPFRALWLAVAVMILAAIAYTSSSFANSDPTGITRDMFTLSGFDSIGLGAAISLIEARKPGLLRPLGSTWACTGALAVLLSPLAFGEDFWPGGTYEIVFPLTLAVIVAGACVGYRGFLKRMLENAPLLYLGRISYGIYIYHYLLLEFVFRWAPHLSAEVGPMRFFTASAATVAAASLSWHLVEAPIASLKRFFPVRGAPSAQPVPSRDAT